MTSTNGLNGEYPKNAKGVRICGAKLRGKRAGETCESSIVMENGRCWLHGGRAPKGAASSQYKDGRYSKYMPKRLLDAAIAAADDPDLLSLRAEIGLVYARLADVLTRVDTGESGKMWEAVKSAVLSYRQKRGTRDEMIALSVLEDAIDAGKSDTEAWREIADLIEQRRKLVESEQKRLVAMNQFITAERAMLLVGALVGIIKTHVSDPKVLSAISTDVGKLLNSGSPAEVETSGAG